MERRPAITVAGPGSGSAGAWAHRRMAAGWRYATARMQCPCVALLIVVHAVLRHTGSGFSGLGGCIVLPGGGRGTGKEMPAYRCHYTCNAVQLDWATLGARRL